MKKWIFVFVVIFMIVIGAFYFFIYEPSHHVYNVAYVGASQVSPYWLKLGESLEEVSSNKYFILEDLTPIYEDDEISESLNYILSNDFDAVIIGFAGKEDLAMNFSRDLYRNGIPSFLIDAYIDSQFVSGYVATDNYESGRIVGQYIYENAESGVVLIVIPNDVHQDAILRMNGAKDVLELNDVVVHVVNIDDLTWGTQGVYSKIKEDFKNNKYSAVFSVWDEASMTTRNYAEDTGYNVNSIYIGFDGLDKMFEKIDEGYVDATIAQSTDMMAIEMFEMIRDNVEGREYSKEVLVPGILVTKKNVDMYL